MKHMTILEYNDGSGLTDKVQRWVSENEDQILEIVDVEYSQHGNIFIATITYEERT
ncbi:hypothetical protein DW1_1549 [Proteiniborus sp. DW1]|uniref:hypothetical protein n=1 Tax=Proteiniborus sp. DW1 TaxID=1889883 RepID=UPI00092DF1BA|nr:hypothetical protein [Proteiniborus sp. DW1]SCG83120.1 hypothetical protein DW1_1549 [Proteiniborus sp. DW1]